MKKILLLLALYIAAALCGCGASDAPASVTTAADTTVAETTAAISADISGVTDSPEATDTDVSVRAAELLSRMTTAQKVGQLFLVRCPATREATDGLIADYFPGGILLFGRDFENSTPDTVRESVASWQSASATAMFVAADEEGGTVTRISRYHQYADEKFASPREVFAAGGWDAVSSDASAKAALLSSLGLNLNLAPVCDVCGDGSAFIYERAFSGDAAEVSHFARVSVSAYSAARVGCALKHFPGYGGTTDTHTALARDDREYAEFAASDLLPFAAGIEAGAPCILVSHIIVSCMDDINPASLSPEIHRVLREDMGFGGVILTDDLLMDAVRDFTGDDGESAVLAVLAGNDMLCCTDYETQIPAVLAAVQSGRIEPSRIDAAVMRILEMKLRLGIIS